MQANNDEITNKPVAGPSKFLLWLGIGTLLFGALFLAFGVSFVFEANESRNWPTATGNVTNVRVTWSLSNRDQAVPDRSYFYEIYYDYFVDDQPYSADRYSLGNGSNASPKTYNNEDDAREAAFAAYQPGQVVTVYYDPADPASAVLAPGASTSTYVPLIFGAVLALSGLGLIWLYRRQAAAVTAET
jgi:hypothetical protein